MSLKSDTKFAEKRIFCLKNHKNFVNFEPRGHPHSTYPQKSPKLDHPFSLVCNHMRLA